jgi:glycosyltransferase involved in cell wall biosynthesis
MCCFNGERFLHEAIRSILAQTHTDWELVFWDNCSTDNSANIVQSYDDTRIKYHKAPFHTDLGGGRAKSWPFLTGEFIAFLDVDDTWENDRLSSQIVLFENPQVVLAAGNVLWMSQRHQQLVYNNKYPRDGNAVGRLLSHYFLSLPSVMLRRSAVDGLDYAFNPNFSHIADYDLFLRTSSVGEIAFVHKQIATWRVDMNSQSWAERSKFYTEHLRWIELHKKADWLRPYRKDLVILQLITIAKKLYFASLNGTFTKSNTSGFIKFLDWVASLAFQLLGRRPCKYLVAAHFNRRIQKWL